MLAIVSLFGANKLDLIDNHSNQSGPCANCGICDPGGFLPTGGRFNTDADILFLGHTPGEGPFGGDKMRRTHLHHPDEDGRSFNSKEESEKHFLEGQWGGGHTMLRRYFFNMDEGSSLPTLKHPTESIYFTNLVKCSLLSEQDSDLQDTSSSEASQLNASAERTCPQYLESEITEVSPEVLLISGSDTWRKFDDYFDAELPRNGTFKNIIGTESPTSYKAELQNTEVSVVPMYHWYTRNYGFLDWSDGSAEVYYSKLAELLDSLVTSDVLQRPT